MAINEYNSDLDIKGRLFSNNVPNSTGSIVTWNATTNVFGLRTNAQIISDLNLSSNFVPYTGATQNVNLGTRSITSTGGFIGNATTATTLATSRTINGTSFDGSANITTANWGTSRNITIGDATKSVNGSENVSWSLAEIGVTTPTLHQVLAAGNTATNVNSLILESSANNNYSIINRYRTNVSGGWARNGFNHIIRNNADTETISNLRIQAYGSGGNIYFHAIGTGSYNSGSTIRFYPDESLRIYLDNSERFRLTDTEVRFSVLNTAGFVKTDNNGFLSVDTNTYALVSSIPTSSDFITTNTNQTGLSGNKETNGFWHFKGLLGSPIALEKSTATNLAIRYINVNGDIIFAGLANGNTYAIGGSVSLNTVANRWMWVDSSGLVSSQSGFSKTGATNNDILLGSGGHRPVSDFALAGSLGNYLPLAGGTMSGAIDFNIQPALSYLGENRIHFGTTSTVISGNSSTGSANGIFFRPINGSSINEVTIDGDGQINTANHGNSGQWKQAYDAIATIPNAPNNGLLTISTSSDLTGGGTFSADQETASNVNIGLSAGTLSNIQLGVTANSLVINGGIPRTSQLLNNTNDLDLIVTPGYYHHAAGSAPLNTPTSGAGYLEVVDNGSNAYIRQTWKGRQSIEEYHRWRSSSGNWSAWVEYITTDNLDTQATSLGFIKSSALPTVNNGQLTLSTGTGLSGSATFTANQSGSSTFSVAVASTHKLPTTTEWNALSTQTLSSSTSNIISGSTVQRAALTGDVTASQNSNVTTIANSAVTHAKYQNIATQRILGRGATGSGNVQELTLGTGLSLSTAGVLSASQDSIFAYSPQGGLYTTNWSSNALGQYSLAIGHASNATAQNATAVGSAVFTGGFGSTNVGFSSNVNKSLAGNFGTYNTNNHRESFTYGLGLQSASTWQTVIGRYNKPNGAGDIDDWTDIRNPIFILGVGQDEMNRKNSVSAFGDGRLDYEVDRDDTNWNDNTIPDIKWIQENISGGGGGGSNYVDQLHLIQYGADLANGLVLDRSLMVDSGNTEQYGIITVYAKHNNVSSGQYGSFINAGEPIFRQFAVTVMGDILVTQGCISTGTDSDFTGGRPYLCVVFNSNDDSISLVWESTQGLYSLKFNGDLIVTLLGMYSIDDGRGFFNMNPQIL